MKPRLLGLTLVVLLPLAASAQESGGPGPSHDPGHGGGCRGGDRAGFRHGPEGREHHHLPGSCFSGAPILYPPIVLPYGGYYSGFGLGYGGGFGLGYGSSFGGFPGISLGQTWTSPLPPYGAGYSYRGSSPAAPSRRRTVRQPKPQLSSPEARARAAQHIEIGDRAFQQQDYGHALSRYKKAIAAAADQAVARFRAAQAYVAIGKFALAEREIERGLYLDPTWPDSDFSIEGLYGGNDVARLADLEELAEAVRDNLDDGDLLFLLGYQLYFSGEPERAIPFFERALDLTDAPNVVLLFFKSPVRQTPQEPRASEPPAKPAPESSNEPTPAEPNPPESRRI